NFGGSETTAERHPTTDAEDRTCLEFIAEGPAKEISQVVDFQSRTQFCPVTASFSPITVIASHKHLPYSLLRFDLFSSHNVLIPALHSRALISHFAHFLR